MTKYIANALFMGFLQARQRIGQKDGKPAEYSTKSTAESRLCVWLDVGATENGNSRLMVRLKWSGRP